MLFIVDKGTDRHTLQAVVRRFELVVEVRERVIDGPEGDRSTCVVGPEELPVFTDLILDESGVRARYEGLKHHELAIELVRDLFADPYGLTAMKELRAWLDEREMPYRCFLGVITRIPTEGFEPSYEESIGIRSLPRAPNRLKEL